MKLPFTLSLALFFRAFPAGLLGAFALYPLLRVTLLQLDISVDELVSFLLLLVVVGWMTLVLGKPIYMLYEGRRYWPRCIHWMFLKLEKWRVRRLASKNQKSFAKGDLRRHQELSVELRRFPMGPKGEYVAEFPTRLGNLMAAYEAYPKRVYGMDSVFYWYRLWLTLTKEDREDLDNHQAIADSVLYTCAALQFASAMALAYIVVQIAHKGSSEPYELTTTLVELLPGTWWLVGLGAVALLGSYGLYRLTLHVHAEFGEFFKALFDTYHKRISVDQVIEDISRFSKGNLPIRADYRERFFIAWRYLHNFRVKTEKGVVSPTELPGWRSPDEAKVLVPGHEPKPK